MISKQAKSGTTSVKFAIKNFIMNFEKLSFTSEYSPKDITLPTNDEFMKKFIYQQEKFGKRFCWRAYFIMEAITNKTSNIPENDTNRNTYGFKSESKPPIPKEIAPFMNEFFDLANKIKFKKCNDPFLKKLNDNLTKMKKLNKIIIPADKTRNLYASDPAIYHEILTNNITEEYKKGKMDMVNKVNVESAKLAAELGLQDRIQAYSNKQTLMTYKDHKDHAITRPTFRVIVPAKTEMGKVSKSKTEKINEHVRSATKLNQWRNTQAVLSWFKNLEKGKNLTFFKFDI